MKKNELIEFLKTAVQYEETAGESIREKCEQCLKTLGRIEMLEEDKDRIRSLLRELTAGSSEHREKLTLLLSEIEIGGQDGF